MQTTTSPEAPQSGLNDLSAIVFGNRLIPRPATPWRATLVCLCVLLTIAMVHPARADWPPKRCTHVVLVSDKNPDEVNSAYLIQKLVELDSPKEFQLKTLGTALDLLPPMVCSAVRKVVFVKPSTKMEGISKVKGTLLGNDEAVTTDAWNPGMLHQDSVFLNTAGTSIWSENNLKERNGEEWIGRVGQQLKAIKVLVHEATHAAVKLLQSQQRASVDGKFDPDADLWPDDATRTALDVIELNRLHGGVEREWNRLQASFVRIGLAGDYAAKNWTAKCGDPAESLAKVGFASAYGAKNVTEDIAEYAAWAAMSKVFEDHPTLCSDVEDTSDAPCDHPCGYTGAACQVMNSRNGSGVSGAVAAIYTKTGFAHALGLVTEAAYKSCIGKLSLHDHGEGVYVWKYLDKSRDGERQIELTSKFTTDVSATVNADENLGQYVFELSAWANREIDAVEGGGKFPTQLVLRVAVAPADRELYEVSWPRGIYNLADIGNSFELDVPDAPASSYFATEGTVFFGYSTSKRLDASMVVIKGVRPHVRPVPLPETSLPRRFTIGLRR